LAFKIMLFLLSFKSMSDPYQYNMELVPINMHTAKVLINNGSFTCSDIFPM